MRGALRGLGDALFIARSDLGRQLRQRQTLVWIFLMPPVFFYFIGTVTSGDAMGLTEVEGAPLVLHVPEHGGFLPDELDRRLSARGWAVARAGELPAPEGAVHLMLPAGTDPGASFTDRVLSGEREVLTFRTAEEGPAARFVEVRLARAVFGLVADLVVLAEEGTEPSAERLRALDEAPRTLRLEVVSAGRRREAPSGFDQAVPGILVMFTMLVLLTTAASQIVEDRQRGLLRRLASTPISRGSLVLGKWVGKMALALVQIAGAAAGGTLLFGADWGPSPAALALVLFGWAAVNASLALLLAGLVRTTAQASGFGLLATMALAALGGCWWPIEVAPGFMQTLAWGLPSGWAMDALHRLTSFGMGGASVLPHVAALLVAALLLGILAARRFRYE